MNTINLIAQALPGWESWSPERMMGEFALLGICILLVAAVTLVMAARD